MPRTFGNASEMAEGSFGICVGLNEGSFKQEQHNTAQQCESNTQTSPPNVVK